MVGAVSQLVRESSFLPNGKKLFQYFNNWYGGPRVYQLNINLKTNYFISLALTIYSLSQNVPVGICLSIRKISLLGFEGGQAWVLWMLDSEQVGFPIVSQKFKAVFSNV